MGRTLVNSVVFLATVAAVASGCDSGSPTQPQQQPTEVRGTITFNGAGPANAGISSHAEAGFTVQFRSGTWEVWTVYGNPAPFPTFRAPGGTSGLGQVQVTAGGAPFTFRSVDLYSSVTPIPYVIIGTRAGTKTFELGDTLPAAGVVGNTFGAFRTVTAPTVGLVDTLTVMLTNPAPPCCDNPMGLDNIVLGR
jgi:hypothetical protein